MNTIKDFIFDPQLKSEIPINAVKINITAILKPLPLFQKNELAAPAAVANKGKTKSSSFPRRNKNDSSCGAERIYKINQADNHEYRNFFLYFSILCLNKIHSPGNTISIPGIDT